MKNLLTLALITLSSHAFAQFTVAYHQSNIPSVALSYEFFDRLRPELRIGTDVFFEDVSLEGMAVFDILNHEDYEFYAGVGLRVEEFAGAVVPVGVNVYPFEVKKFGFHIELAPIFGEDYDVLRGSWGIRWRFGR